MTPILFRRCRLEKDDSDGVAATRSELPWWRVKCVELFAETLTSVWRRVDGQKWMFLAAMCKAIENLHSDVSYVLIGGQR